MNEFVVNNPQIAFVSCVALGSLFGSLLARAISPKSNKARVTFISVGIAIGAVAGGILVF